MQNNSQLNNVADDDNMDAYNFDHKIYRSSSRPVVWTLSLRVSKGMGECLIGLPWIKAHFFIAFEP